MRIPLVAILFLALALSGCVGDSETPTSEGMLPATSTGTTSSRDAHAQGVPQGAAPPSDPIQPRPSEMELRNCTQQVLTFLRSGSDVAPLLPPGFQSLGPTGEPGGLLAQDVFVAFRCALGRTAQGDTGKVVFGWHGFAVQDDAQQTGIYTQHLTVASTELRDMIHGIIPWIYNTNWQSQFCIVSGTPCVQHVSLDQTNMMWLPTTQTHPDERPTHVWLGNSTEVAAELQFDPLSDVPGSIGSVHVLSPVEPSMLGTGRAYARNGPFMTMMWKSMLS